MGLVMDPVVTVVTAVTAVVIVRIGGYRRDRQTRENSTRQNYIKSSFQHR